MIFKTGEIQRAKQADFHYLYINIYPCFMKKIFIFLSILPWIGFSQTYIPITNNMTINSNSNIKFIPDNYIFTDPGLDGVIKVSNVHDVILDGDSCTVDGTDYTGYCIKIDNSYNIRILNFDSVFHYKYAVYITNSHHIIINGNDFSHNKVDSTGWIDVWTNYNQALGGGVMMYQSRATHIYDNTMSRQNDGVALYHCDSIKIHDNNFEWNTSYGIRMFWTDSCHIYNNLANHINRPNTDPSDCAAILMIISNENRVENNDFSYSGDGIFLGQYQHSNIPNNNWFANNECSYSPHNAIEATFADGNVYKNNICNYSHYGFWLGYSFNSLVDSNQVYGNFNSGIAIDKGYSNTITNNVIGDNPIGIELWEGGIISGYELQTSHDYWILNNNIDGNTAGISAKATEHSIIQNNTFHYNQNPSIYFDGISTQDTLAGNSFRSPTAFHIYNASTNNIYAPGNTWEPSDSLMIEDKIFDKQDNSLKGRVLWSPAASAPAPVIQDNPPCDMAEPDAIWYAYPEIGYPGPRKTDSVYFDYSEKKIGSASVKLVSGRGWYDGLNFRPAADSLAQWVLTEQDTLSFWVRTIRHPMGFQYFHIRIGDYKGDYYKYTASPSLLNTANLAWKQYKVPIAGNGQFFRSTVGTMTLDSVNYVEIDADTWDYGFTLWVDGVQFSPCDPVTGITEPELPHSVSIQNYPNPFTGTTQISFDLPLRDHVLITIYDINGSRISTLIDKNLTTGSYVIPFDGSDLEPGIYLIQLVTAKEKVIRKMIVIR